MNKRNTAILKGPNITHKHLIHEEEIPEKAKLTVQLMKVENPPNEPAPGKHEYIEIGQWYWHKGAKAWMVSKKHWFRLDTHEERAMVISILDAAVGYMNEKY